MTHQPTREMIGNRLTIRCCREDLTGRNGHETRTNLHQHKREK